VEHILTRFVIALRERGVRVSPGESLDAMHALALGGVTERDAVRALLRLTLVKHVHEFAIFDEVFDSFFQTGQRRIAGGDPVDMLGALIHIVEGEQLKSDLLRQRPEEEGPRLRVDEEVTAEDLENLLGLEEGDDDTEGAELEVKLDGHRGRRDAAAPSDFYMKSPPTVAFHQGGSKGDEPPFTPAELSEMQEVVGRMIVRIRKDVKRMREMESRGKLHVIRTIQKNYRHGMVPFLLSLRRKRKEKPRLVVFCDVSYSVSHATRFMLLLLHTLQNRVMDVRSFVFNREVTEITEQLRNMPVNSLLETIDRGEIVNLDDNSDYGHVFLTFKKKHLESMRGKPAIIIMGDGRNNYNEANEWALEEIREKAGYMLWLTPEERDLWHRGDCLMELYGEYCDKVEVVSDAAQLSVVVEELLHTLYDHHDTRAWKRRRTAPKEEESYDYRTYYTRKGSGSAPAFDPEVRRQW